MPSTKSKKQVTLTPNEQLLHVELLNRRVCSLKDIAIVSGNYKTARDTLSRMAGKGYALRVHRGYYAGVPPERVGENYEIDRYVLGHRVGGPGGAFAYHSALELHGVAHSYFNETYYFRERPLRPFRFQNVEYRYVTSCDLFGVKEFVREGIYVPVTDRERTFLDCVRRPDYCGGLEEVLKSLDMFHSLDFDILEEYLERFGERGLRQKTGYILSILKAEVSREFLRTLKKHVGGRAYYIQPRTKSGEGRLVKEWNVIVPRNLDEVMRFA